MLPVLLLVLTAPKTFTGTREGQELKVLAEAAQVASSPVLGKRLGFSLAGDTADAFPKVDVTVAWAKVEGKKEVSLSVKRPKLGAEVQAFYRGGKDDKPMPTEKATLSLKLEAEALTADLEISFVKGPTLKCRLEKLALVHSP